MKLRLLAAVAFGAAIVMALFLARGAPAVTGVPCAPTGLEQIATGFPDYFRVPVSGPGNYYKLIVPSPSTFTSGCLAPSGGYITTSSATQSTDQLYQPGYSITVNQYSNSGCTTQTATRTLTNMFLLLNAWSFDNATNPPWVYADTTYSAEAFLVERGSTV